MAVYEFRCSKCGHDFEVMRPMSESGKPAKCPKCGSRGERLISDFSSNQGSVVQGPTGAPLREPPPKPLTPTRPATRPKIVQKKPTQLVAKKLKTSRGRASSRSAQEKRQVKAAKRTPARRRR